MPSTSQLETQFAEVKAILDAAIKAGGGTYTGSTYGRAVAFRHRMYTFRKAWREAISPHGSIYDRITLRSIVRGETAFRIEILREEGAFIPDEGGEGISPAAQMSDSSMQSIEELQWEAEAKALAEKIL